MDKWRWWRFRCLPGIAVSENTWRSEGAHAAAPISRLSLSGFLVFVYKEVLIVFVRRKLNPYLFNLATWRMYRLLFSTMGMGY